MCRTKDKHVIWRDSPWSINMFFLNLFMSICTRVPICAQQTTFLEQISYNSTLSYFRRKGSKVEEIFVSVQWPNWPNSFGWWFQFFVIFNPTWGRFPIWLIFLKWVETTNSFFGSRLFWRWFTLHHIIMEVKHEMSPIVFTFQSRPCSNSMIVGERVSLSFREMCFFTLLSKGFVCPILLKLLEMTNI